MLRACLMALSSLINKSLVRLAFANNNVKAIPYFRAFGISSSKRLTYGQRDCDPSKRG